MGDSTFLTSIRVTNCAAKQKQREDLVSSIGSSGTKILQIHNELQGVADDLDQRVEYLLGVNEKDFFLAYKTHMFQVQKEFKMLKSKADEEETKTRRDAKIGSLEKELSWFTNESLRLDELCKKYKQQVDKWKQRATGLDDDRRFLENQIRAAKKQNRALRSAVEQSVTLSQIPAAVLDGARALEDQTDDVETQIDEAPEPLSKEAKLRYSQTIKTLHHQLVMEKRRNARLRDSRKMIGGVSRLEEYFVECINIVKKEIFERRQQILYGSALTSPSMTKINGGQGSSTTAFVQSKMNLQCPEDVTMEFFTTADRRRVIDLLFQDKDIQALIHHKVLPQKILEVAN